MSVGRRSQLPLHAAGLSRGTVDANILGRIGATPDASWSTQHALGVGAGIAVDSALVSVLTEWKVS